ncbi:hypothetical protein PILCRDRAFT_9538 [Piloderma croceum F 1598]|uniref:Uncharacterized protein n=1 Tax=Piloderma croceum (strain F 1598) TaxID=765440 RepID=A0A0C3B296_PILCF|nr:hypothetical protein PILCRDRAFT_9538 [Piloderma croceum F 1598]
MLYAPYAARIRPYRVWEHTVSVRAYNGYGQNVVEMPPARVWMLYIRGQTFDWPKVKMTSAERGLSQHPLRMSM